MSLYCVCFLFFFSSRRRHTRSYGDWSSDVCSSDLLGRAAGHRIWATSRSEAKQERALELGADQVFPAGSRLPERVDAVMETRSEERRVGKEGRSRGAR